MLLKKSMFNFLHYEIKKLSINAAKKTNKQLQYYTQMSVSSIQYEKELAHFGIKLEIKGKWEEEIFQDISIEIIGYFDGFSEMGKEKFEKYCQGAGVPNLIQVARSTISSVTSMMNILPPVNLPLFNLKKSIEEQKG